MKEIFTMDFKGKLLIAVVFMVLGFMLSVQYKTTERQRSVRMDRVEDLSERLKGMEAENKQLLAEVESLRAGAADDPADERMKLMAGLTDVDVPAWKLCWMTAILLRRLTKTPTFTSSTMRICCGCSMNCVQPEQKQFR